MTNVIPNFYANNNVYNFTDVAIIQLQMSEADRVKEIKQNIYIPKDTTKNQSSMSVY